MWIHTHNLAFCGVFVFLRVLKHGVQVIFSIKTPFWYHFGANMTPSETLDKRCIAVYTGTMSETRYLKRWGVMRNTGNRLKDWVVRLHWKDGLIHEKEKMLRDLIEPPDIKKILLFATYTHARRASFHLTDNLDENEHFDYWWHPAEVYVPEGYCERVYLPPNESFENHTVYLDTGFDYNEQIQHNPYYLAYTTLVKASKD